MKKFYNTYTFSLFDKAEVFLKAGRNTEVEFSPEVMVALLGGFSPKGIVLSKKEIDAEPKLTISVSSLFDY
jgi:hypothetical protein